MICASAIFFLAYKKRKELLLWFMSCTLTAIGYTVNAFPQEVGNEINPASMVLFSMGTFVLFYAVLREYYQTFMKNKRLQKKSIKYAVALSGTITFSFYYMMLGLIILCFVLIILLYLRKRSLLHAFYCLNFVGALLSLFGAIVGTSGSASGTEFNNFAMTFMDTIYLVMGIVAIVEYRNQKMNENFKTLITAASDTSISVSNVATELAASASEVNAASEEIYISTQVPQKLLRELGVHQIK
jgi:hypothetical protein